MSITYSPLVHFERKRNCSYPCHVASAFLLAHIFTALLKLDELAVKQHSWKMFLAQLPQISNIERGIQVEAFYFAT
jgi:hypothetical protein